MTKELAKLTLKDMGIAVPKGGGDFIGKTVVAIKGLVTGYGIKHTQYGESTMLQGTFVGVKPDTGEVFESVKAYLPEEFSQTVAQKLDKSEGGEVEFEIQINVAASEASSRGYTYVCKAVQTPETINRKNLMASELLNKVKALPAPEAAPKKKAS